ncbi:hypothetical protein L1999_24240 [Neobacillus drentensis]|uniref:hypothetical protein n=1 Tax=Neobacillus drentensis TaxID=220684 RepID=UPI001F268E71|nr:hypothetical protein [Neobacillus drentensis]ULT56130.1 hypothetical protein L1999_24240 [Neobacillus drentensis]
MAAARDICDLESGIGRAAIASPLLDINGGEPPFLILHGSGDLTLSPDIKGIQLAEHIEMYTDDLE